MSSSNNIYHVFINQENDLKDKNRDSTMYRWRDAYDFMQYGHIRIMQAFNRELPTTHQQCSHSPIEAVKENKLLCCLGEQVITCPILLRLKATFEEHWSKPIVECSGYDPGEYYRKEVSQEDMYRTMAKVCAHHIYEESRVKFVDSSEGFHLDTTDRMYWSRVYANLAAVDQEQDEDETGTSLQGNQ